MDIVGIHLLSVMMWEARTVPRPHGIDMTHIGLEIQELTGLFYIHPIPRLILIQPLLLEFGLRHVEMFGDAANILSRIGGRHRLAAIGAIQTIRTLPYFLVRLENKIMKPLERMLFQPA